MRINLVLFAVFLGVALLFGGASRPDVLSLPVVRCAAIVMIAIAWLQIERDEWRAIRAPVLFLLAIAALIAAQLIPLPAAWWAALPGRDSFREMLSAAGIDGVWRPLSLTPDLTLNALLALLPPLAAILGLGLIDRAYHALLLPLLLAGIAASALLGMLQLAGGGPYFYSITNPGTAVGFFSNRNHLAVLIAAAFPLLACWAALPHADPAYRRLRAWIALCAAAAIFPLLLTTGSRAGLALGVIAALGALGIRRRRRHGGGGRPRRSRLVALVPVAVGALAILATIFLARDEGLRRLLAGGDMERRFEFLPVYVSMIGDYMPFGSGYGSFDTVFRAYEPAETLTSEYMNQAHNDWAQVLIEGGLFPLLLAILFLVWFAVRSWRLWWTATTDSGRLLGRAGSLVVLLILLSSTVEYPLRTPFIAVLMALACCWMIMAPTHTVEAEVEHGEGLGSQPSLR